MAGGMRFADLSHCPDGLFRDEAEKGYNGWALATTGGALDFTGGATPGPTVAWRRLPWMINVMGGKTSAIYQYASVPFMWAGGLNVSTTRMASAFFGTLTVALIGLLLMRAWGAWPGLAVAAWLALSPWHLVFSRWALEGIFVPFFIVLALAGLWGLGKGRKWGLPLAGAALGWLFYSYSGAQPFVLAWGVCLLALYWRKLSVRDWPLWLGCVLFLIPVVPTILVRLEPGGSTRLGHVAIWNEPGISALGIVGRFLINYLKHFDPRFLFLQGDTLPRHGIPHMGQLTLVDALLVPVGFVAVWRRSRPLAGALVAAFLCGPLPAAITREGIPHALRAFAMAVPAAAWGGMGLYVISDWLYSCIQKRGIPQRRARLFAGAFAAACLLAGLNGFAIYWRADHRSPLVWVAFESGERQAWEAVAGRKKPGERVFVNGYIPYAPYFQLFFLKPPARSVRPEDLGDGDFIYFDPEHTSAALVKKNMRPGDWLIQAASPSMIENPFTGQALLSPQEARLVREPWIVVTQK